ncbi:MAG: BNR-4 repeat-containing protein [Planctomycetota bacterium]|jgi:hypothetical protein
MQRLSAIGSERATNDPNKVVEVDGRLHATWQEIDGDGYYNVVASCDLTTGEWGEPIRLDTGVDNHARSVITVDAKGFLHVVLGGHCTPCFSRSSLRPNDSSAWGEPEQICWNGTYPILLCDPEGSLHVALRGKASKEERVAGVNLYVKPAGGAWEHRSRIISNLPEYEAFYAGYPTRMAVGPDGVIHALVSVYEGNDEVGRGYNQAIVYVHSCNGALTWQCLDGTAVPTPARPEEMDLLIASTRPRVEPTPVPEIAPGGVVVDSCGRPTLFFLTHHDQPGEIVMAVPDGGDWQSCSIQEVLTERWPEMRARGCIPTIRSDDSFCLLVILTPLDERWSEGKPVRDMIMAENLNDRLVWMISGDGGASFTVETAVEPGTSCNNPSVEFPAGANHLPADRLPHILTYDGSNAYPGGGEYYNKSVAEMVAAGEFTTCRVNLIG